MAIPITERSPSPSGAPLRLALMGRQGAGKGTQCERLERTLGVVHVSTGDLLRRAISEGTPLGRRVASLVESGALVPDAIVTEIVLERLAEPDVVPRGFVLDGFPRTVNQAAAITDLHAVDTVVDLAVPTAVVVERLGRRRVCPTCGTVTAAASVDDDFIACPRGDGLATRRADDTVDAIRKRLALYDAETGPVLAWYAARGLLATVDATGSSDDVFDGVVRVVAPPVPAAR